MSSCQTKFALYRQVEHGQNTMVAGIGTQIVSVFPMAILNEDLVEITIFPNAANDNIGAVTKKQYGITYAFVNFTDVEFQRDIVGGLDLSLDMTYSWIAKEFAPNVLNGVQ